MNEIQIIKNTNILNKEVNVYGTEENPLFFAKDVASWIDVSNVSDLCSRIDEDEKTTIVLTETGFNYKHPALFLTEDGLYEVLMQSRKPIAKQFKKAVKDVLKEIRKTGGYIATNANDTDEEIMAKALLVAQRTIERKNEIIKQQADKIEQDAPKVVFADAVIGSQSSCLVGELAKILTQNGYTIGQNKLFEKLRKEGYLGTRGEHYNIPNQQYITMGLFELKKSTHSENGVMKSSVTPKVTGKGQQYFINKFLNKS